ncbi:LytTR family DNA-binding domain-containing protein [Roseibacterium sp. SDUM158017]|uniref:LytTR family DNA-binding domain-containing protein n=1 Tax=Roseicyclus salinarum TaxID=3036773 RepID=UPI002414DD5D|nr:LytTR family DNA-binding domain-containing protein [Roseibacterium sp. SDUM158017]MDG4648233.1 LytTR family DNA-binding domain-containing protein [Roseibacterium sp. SDUM158017]
MDWSVRIPFSRRHGTWLVFGAGWAVSSVLCALVGPAGTFSAMSFEHRLVYWGGLIAVGLAMGLVIGKLVPRVVRLGAPGTDLVGAAALSLTLGPSVCVFNDLLLGPHVITSMTLLHHVAAVFAASLLVVVVRHHARMHALRAGPAGGEEGDAGGQGGVTAGAEILSEAAEWIGGDLRWVSADDHYLRVHTTQGSSRILMRFGDALRELATLPGLRVHRSHWVALDAVSEVRPAGKRYVAVLQDGTEVPVSRSYLRDVRAAGLLGDDEA